MITFIQKNAVLLVGLLFVGSFLVMSIFFAVAGMVSPQVTERASELPRNPGSTIAGGEVPVRVVIDTIGVDTVIYTPESTNIRVLDQALTRGAVHYPTSGTPGEGNMLLFGHSTSLSNVINQAYKTFNGVQNLEKGDEIVVYTDNQKHVYKVLTVELVNADEALIDFSQDKNMLTLSTCNTFGAKQERFVVEADYIGVQ